jgi:hypothetical protein
MAMEMARAGDRLILIKLQKSKECIKTRKKKRSTMISTPFKIFFLVFAPRPSSKKKI